MNSAVPGDDGYVRGIDYTHGYCAELAPGLLSLACASRGLAGFGTGRPLRCLELAFGQGLSLNIHAAAAPGEYEGIDFNPAHAACASALAAASGAPLGVHAESFEAFAARADLPAFDLIALHGTWSWISAANRHLVVEIVRRRLAPGGAFFVSYNCMPGWAAEVPLRHLLVQHAARAAAPEADIAARIAGAIGFAQSLSAAGARLFRAHQGLDAWLADMRGRDPRYLAHEYFNRDWQPMPSSDVSAALSAAGLTFAASATLSDHLPGAGLSAAACALLDTVEDPVLRETVLDCLVNRRFRRDLYLRDATPLAPGERLARLRGTAFVLLQHPEHVPDTVRVSGGEAQIARGLRDALSAALAAQDYAPKTPAWLETQPGCREAGFANLWRALLLLVSAGSLHPAQSAQAIEAAAPRCRALNARLLETAASSGDVPALASPVIGAGVYAERREMLFLHAIALGKRGEEEWARHAWQCLNPESGEESLQDALLRDARLFARYRLPAFRALRLA